MFTRFIKYYWHANTIYQMHSPFLFQFSQHILESPDIADAGIEKLRRKMLGNTSTVSRTDFGAGSKRLSRESQISAIAKSSLSRPLICQWLFKMTRQFQPLNILEFGTSLGISTSYLQKGSPRSRVTTVEGDPAVYDIARKNFTDLNLEIRAVNATFDHFIDRIMEKDFRPGFIFLDGHHDYEATIRYFNKLKPRFGKETIVVLDDIHWNSGMEKAWEEIKSDPGIRFSIDLFQLGILFFSPENIRPEHAILIPRKYKPWKIHVKP